MLAQDILLKKEPHREIVLGELSEYVLENWGAMTTIAWEYLTIILRGRAGYEMIYNQRGA